MEALRNLLAGVWFSYSGKPVFIDDVSSGFNELLGPFCDAGEKYVTFVSHSEENGLEWEVTVDTEGSWALSLEHDHFEGSLDVAGNANLSLKHEWILSEKTADDDLTALTPVRASVKVDLTQLEGEYCWGPIAAKMELPWSTLTLQRGEVSFTAPATAGSDILTTAAVRFQQVGELSALLSPTWGVKIERSGEWGIGALLNSCLQEAEVFGSVQHPKSKVLITAAAKVITNTANDSNDLSLRTAAQFPLDFSFLPPLTASVSLDSESSLGLALKADLIDAVLQFGLLREAEGTVKFAFSVEL